MKIEIKNVVKLFAFLVCLLPVWTWAASYEVSTSTSIVDGDRFCGGSACTSSDTIIIKGGARGNLMFQDFNGSGSYITITNENTDPNSKVVITNDGSVGFGVLSLSNCKYVDLRGDNDGDLTCGIHVINDDTPSSRSGAIRVYGKSDHIKLSYLEADCTDNSTISGIGIQVGDKFLTSAWTINNLEIHHNYIHDTRYSGMYLGHNDPKRYNDPYIARFSVYNNIIENAGTYGMVLKGLNGGPNSFYNNIVDTTGVVSRPNISDEWRTGIRVRTYTSRYSVDVYNNFVIDTVGPGILAGKGSHNIYNNIVCNAGTGNNKDWGHGITLYLNTNGTDVYDNIIIQPTRYGIYNKNSATNGVTLSRNRIGDAGLGKFAEAYSGDTIESIGANANIYNADVADFNFNTWSDDGNYRNDNFTNDNFTLIKSPDNLRIY